MGLRATGAAALRRARLEGSATLGFVRQRRRRRAAALLKERPQVFEYSFPTARGNQRPASHQEHHH